MAGDTGAVLSEATVTIALFDPTADPTLGAIVGGLLTFAQTFTAEVTSEAQQVDITLVRNGSFTAADLGNVTVQILTTSEGVPSETVLASVTVPGISLPEGAVFHRTFTSFTLPTRVMMVAGQSYVIVASTDSPRAGDATGPYFWSGVNSNAYPGGETFVLDNRPGSKSSGEFVARGTDLGFRVIAAPGGACPPGTFPPFPPNCVRPPQVTAGPLRAIAMKWSCLIGSPSCDNPMLVNETNFRNMLWRRHERPSDCIWIPQCNITLRSAAQSMAQLAGQFAQLPDADTTLGTPGDVVICLPQQPCPGATPQVLQPDVLRVWDAAAAAWGDVNKGVVAVSVKRIITPNGVSIARALVVPNPAGGIITTPWILVADPTHLCEGNSRTLAKMIGEVLTLGPDPTPGNLMRPLQPGDDPAVAVSLMAEQAQQARNYLESAAGMVLDPPLRASAQRSLSRRFMDQVYDGIEAAVPLDQKYLDVINSVVIDSGAAEGQVVFYAGLVGQIAPRGPEGETGPVSVAFALDCDNNLATGDNAGLVVPGLNFPGAEYVAELLVDRKSLAVMPVLKTATGLGSFINVEFQPGVFSGQASRGFLHVIDPTPAYDGPEFIPFTTELRATLSATLFTEALAAADVPPDESGRTFPGGLRFQVTTSQGAGQRVVDMNPPEKVVAEFEETSFPELIVPRRVAPGQRVQVRVTGMPPRVPLHALVAAFVVEQVPIARTDAQGMARFELPIPSDARLGPALLTIGVDDENTAVTADGVIEVSNCPPDLDGNGRLTIFDFLEFQNLWQAGDVAADYNGDGDLTIFDVLAYQNAYQQGCLGIGCR